MLTGNIFPAHTAEPFPAVAELSDNVDQVGSADWVPECALLADMVVVSADIAATCHILAAERIGFHVWSELTQL
jgi:hypothetical protein